MTATTVDLPLLSYQQALLFAGYTAEEVASSGLDPRELIALAASEAKALGALVVVTVRDCGVKAMSTAAKVARGLGALLRLPASRRRKRVDTFGLCSGHSRPRNRVTPRAVWNANYAGSGWE